jgi:hypothetical protein
MKTFAALLLSTIAASATAGLGGPLSSFEAARSSTPDVVTRAGTAPAAWTRVTKTLDAGTEVRQFVNDSGTVFAVSWAGPSLPDLRELLGANFQFLVDESSQAARRPQLVVRRTDFMLVSTGRMGAFEGKAWMPSLLPSGVTAEAIQ